MPGGAGRDRGHVAEHEVPVAHEVARVGKGAEVLAQDMVLDELHLILLLERDEHADDVLHQVATAFGHAVEEQRLLQRLVLELEVLLVERVGLEVDLDDRLLLGSGRCAAHGQAP